MSQETYESIVKKAKEHIAAGDIYQVVLSQRFEAEVGVDAFTVYRALRHVNPSPYMFFIRMGDRSIVGSSPEMLVRVEGRHAITHPIAGTRPRGKSEEEDVRLGEELKRNEKEKAEHVMLVDLGRNDIGRVCDYGTVRVPDLHGARALLARHAPGLGGRGAARRRQRSTRRAGVVLSRPARCPARPRCARCRSSTSSSRPGAGCMPGAVGYLDFAGNLDFCIAIRSILLEGGKAYIQAGAGIVADSNPTAEYEETGQGARDDSRPRARAGWAVSAMVLVIDNYDSFTYNLVQYLGELGATVVVRRNDEASLDAAARPGPRSRGDLARAGTARAGRRVARR